MFLYLWKYQFTQFSNFAALSKIKSILIGCFDAAALVMNFCLLFLFWTGKSSSKESETKASSKDDTKTTEKAKAEEKPKEGSAAKGQR